MYSCMKLRHLEEYLQGMEDFENPKIFLEQYQTTPHLASHILHTIQSVYGDIEGKLVADLGCGCGMLTVGAAALESALSIGFEIDGDALEIALRNSEFSNIDFIKANVTESMSELWSGKFDTVIMNPPFGTKHNTGMDMKFLQTAFDLATTAVYSLHKTSTRNYVKKIAAESGWSAKVLAELRYDLPATYRFHKKCSVDVQVDFYRFVIN